MIGYEFTPVVIYRINDLDGTPLPMRGQTREARAARLAANPDRQEGLMAGRRRLAAAAMHANGGTRGLAELRLAAGMSQCDVAMAMGTHQPNVARQERRPGDLSLTSLRQWAKALGCSLQDVIEAVDVSNRRSDE